jgi:hypothetical protein
VKELQGLMSQMPRRAASKRDAQIDPEKWREWIESLADTPAPEDESEPRA